MSTMTASDELQQHLPDRLEDFRRLTAYDATESDESREEREEELYNYALSVENIRTVKILLSTGGPADWLEIQLDGESVRRIEYHFSPSWFDHASVTLEGDDFDAAVSFARQLTADFYSES